MAEIWELNVEIVKTLFHDQYPREDIFVLIEVTKPDGKYTIKIIGKYPRSSILHEIILKSNYYFFWAGDIKDAPSKEIG